MTSFQYKQIFFRGVEVDATTKTFKGFFLQKPPYKQGVQSLTNINEKMRFKGKEEWWMIGKFSTYYMVGGGFRSVWYFKLLQYLGFRSEPLPQKSSFTWKEEGMGLCLV